MASENTRYRNQIEASLIRKAWRDERFRQRLLQNPQDVFKEELQDTDIGDAHFRVVEETPDTFYLVLPMRPPGFRSDQELADMATRGTYRLQAGMGFVVESRSLVDLNHATVQQLAEALWSVDVEFADAIQSSRPFRFPGDLHLTFSTITSRLLEQIKDQFVVSTPAQPPAPGRAQVVPQPPTSGSSVIYVNSASNEELRALPGLATAFAEAIIDGRPYYSIDQPPQRAPLIGSKAYDRLRSQLAV